MLRFDWLVRSHRRVSVGASRGPDLGRDIIESDLNEQQVESLVKVLKRFKRAIGWTIADIIGIHPGIYSHKIQLMPDHKPSIEH